jgi:curved DNA-binding protein CbpA
MGSTGKPNYYELLEIAPDASQSEVSKAYQKAKQTYDLDNPALYSMFSPEEAKELLKLVDEAYGILSSTANRRDYDQSLGYKNKGSNPAPAQAPSQHASQPQANKSSASSQNSNQPERSSARIAQDQRSGDDRRAVASTGKTQLSTYKIDKDLDEQIAAMSEFNGSSLEMIRLYKNITLERMSELTRISRTYLTAVEHNDYKNLPAAVFVRGFIVQVARALGLDEQKVASSYMKLFKAGGGK